MASKSGLAAQKEVVVFDTNAKVDPRVKKIVEDFLQKVNTLEKQQSMPVVIFQDGVNNSYYVKCNILAHDAVRLFDLDARINVTSAESFRSNRNLLLSSKTYGKMQKDAESGR